MFYKSSKNNVVNKQQAEYYSTIAACQHKLNCPKKEHIRRYLRSNLSKITILVIRLGGCHPPSLGCSKPCIECLHYMKMLGIQHVVYSSGNNTELIKQQINDIDGKPTCLQKNINVTHFRHIKVYFWLLLRFDKSGPKGLAIGCVTRAPHQHFVVCTGAWAQVRVPPPE